MGVKETPTNFRVYYTSMKNAITQKRSDAVDAINDLHLIIDDKYEQVSGRYYVYKDSFNIDLNQYKEFITNKYDDGEFLRMAKGAYLNRKNDYQITADLFNLYDLALKQKQLSDIYKDIELYDKLLGLGLREYTEILRKFYTEVHKKLILEGAGYAFEGDIGWTCINRVKLIRPKSHIDYAKTKQRKAELQAQNAHLYNPEEAKWCRERGIEYKGIDFRVMRDNEYCYEIPLIGSKLPDATKLKLEISDYRHTKVRGKTNEQLREECHNRPEEICELPVDLRTKLNMSLESNPILYTKYIRNENQESVAFRASNR